MKKIPTLFKRDPDNLSRVLNEVNPAAQWVVDGHGIPTRQMDGTCTLFDGSAWWARREVKPGKLAPPNFKPVETDEMTGKTFGWEPIAQSAFVRFWLEAKVGHAFDPGTYELCGPKINGNPEGLDRHRLIGHGVFLAPIFADVPRDFDGLREFLLAYPHEGVVWHNTTITFLADSDLAVSNADYVKIKRRDFGY